LCCPKDAAPDRSPLVFERGELRSRMIRTSLTVQTLE
jgi:hypothetical protein